MKIIKVYYIFKYIHFSIKNAKSSTLTAKRLIVRASFGCFDVFVSKMDVFSYCIAHMHHILNSSLDVNDFLYTEQIGYHDRNERNDRNDRNDRNNRNHVMDEIVFYYDFYLL